VLAFGQAGATGAQHALGAAAVAAGIALGFRLRWAAAAVLLGVLAAGAFLARTL
jgi:hypothetical protein